VAILDGADFIIALWLPTEPQLLRPYRTSGAPQRWDGLQREPVPALIKGHQGSSVHARARRGGYGNDVNRGELVPLALRKQLPLLSARLGLAFKAGSANSRLHAVPPITIKPGPGLLGRAACSSAETPRPWCTGVDEGGRRAPASVVMDQNQ
jgi:hypothetical protein